MSHTVQRAAFDIDDVVLSFANIAADGPGGSIRIQNIDNTPSLSALRDQASQAIVDLKPCGIVSPHHHPGGTELNHVTKGKLTYAFIEELWGRGVLGPTTQEAGSTVLLPQGLVHLTVNEECEPAQFLATFPINDAATVFASPTLFSFDTRIVAATLGVDWHTARKVQEAATEGFTPFPIDGACAKRCGIKV